MRQYSASVNIKFGAFTIAYDVITKGRHFNFHLHASRLISFSFFGGYIQYTKALFSSFGEIFLEQNLAISEY